MTEKEAIFARHSVRQFRDVPIEEEKVCRLNEIIDECNSKSGLNFQLIINDAECFDTFLAHYGKFSNAKNYIALVGKKSTENLDELCGYYGQKIVLAAQMLGLNTCWVAGTYGKGKCKADILSGEKIVCVIAVGYGENQGRERKSRPLEKLCNVDEQNIPVWFKDGMEAAMKAPTALNQQKFYITLDGENVTFRAKHVPLAKLDLGIVKYNFEIGSGKSLAVQ